MLTVDSILKTFSKKNSIKAGYIYTVRGALMAVLDAHIINNVQYCACYILSQGETTFSVGDVVEFRHMFFKRYIPLNDMIEHISLKNVAMIIKCPTCGALSQTDCINGEYIDDIDGICEQCNSDISVIRVDNSPSINLVAGQVYDLGGIKIFLLHQTDKYWHCMILESSFKDIPKTGLVIVPIQNIVSAKLLDMHSCTESDMRGGKNI